MVMNPSLVHTALCVALGQLQQWKVVRNDGPLKSKMHRTSGHYSSTPSIFHSTIQ
ncbi:hypothetical protein RchiOBHm_Chr4g0430381 [Rosa chinensis]|uniref:Uncharacterized protein n=1 Tax=Rosa chinensis TaxID=74649 RepID=A0A2P6R0C8_ROSCH|nr:hypothetical protein RchiOBHm_Chr4g0430381 [Rosa chinensis]